MARRKVITVSAYMVANMMRGHDMMEIRTDVPADMVIVGCGWDETRNSIRLAVESEEWDEVEDGMFAPDFTPIVTMRISELDAILRLVSDSDTKGT